jgi:sugar phosphate isomerase/epimerase
MHTSRTEVHSIDDLAHAACGTCILHVRATVVVHVVDFQIYHQQDLILNWCYCRYESNVLNTAAQAMELLEDANHPNIFVHLDSYHMNIEESSLELAVQLCGSKLGYVHLGESHR